MRIYKLLLLFVIITIHSTELFATHLIGGTMDYIRLGPGSFPNSSRYKIKLKIYRNDSIGSIALPDRVLIYVRGDIKSPFDPALKPNNT